jgi:predicted nuclease with TOPRIM domain
MMREAQKMMNDPAFQARMKQLTDNPQFKEHMAKTNEMMKDKDKMKEMEESMKARLEEGQKDLEEFKKKSAELE